MKQNPTIVGGVMAGGAAWQAGIQADDKVLEVAGRKVHNFRHMTEEIVNADLAHGVPLLIQRPGVKDPLEIVVKPEQLAGAPTNRRLQFVRIEARQREEHPSVSSRNPRRPTPRARCMPGDRIVQIDGQPIDSYGQLQDYPGRPRR